MKKLLALLLTISCLSITACASNKAETTTTAEQEDNTVDETEEVAEGEINIPEFTLGDQTTIDNVLLTFDEIYVVNEKIRFSDHLGFADPQPGCHYIVLEGTVENGNGETARLASGDGYIMVNDEYKYDLDYYLVVIPGSGGFTIDPLVDLNYIVFGQISDKLLENLNTVEFVFSINRDHDASNTVLPRGSYLENPEEWDVLSVKSSEIGFKATTLD